MTSRLHIGADTTPLEGWINLDIAPYPGIDAVVDVRDGLPYSDVSYIFAEHFVEHLVLEDGSRFMRECRRVLREDGVLRLSTPNLDWVWLTHYKPPAELTVERHSSDASKSIARFTDGVISFSTTRERSRVPFTQLGSLS